MSPRQAIIVDIETTSLDVETCAILEVAAINMETGESMWFVPYVDPQDLADAEPMPGQQVTWTGWAAREINRRYV